MLILVLIIMGCSLIGTVILIGLCGTLSAAMIPPIPAGDEPPATVIEEPIRDDRNYSGTPRNGVSGESDGEDAIRTILREGIASSSFPILRARGMSDEEIKSELLRDFALTEKQVDEILAAQ